MASALHGWSAVREHPLLIETGYVQRRRTGRQAQWNMSTQSLPLRVLVVDDEPLICWSLAATLGDSGTMVTEAASGAAALRALAETRAPFDVVLLDYNLPDVQNLNLLSTVRRLRHPAASF